MSISNKEHLHTLLAERNRTNTAWRIGMGSTAAAMFFSILTAFTVYRASAAELLRLHNDLIRKGEREGADIKAEMATKTQVAPLETYVSGEQASAVTTGKLIGYLFATAALSVSIGAGLVSLL